MSIKEVGLFHYDLPLVGPVRLRGQELTQRHGYLIRFILDSGEQAWGEVAPLPGFSREDSGQVLRQLRLLKSSLTGTRLPDNLEKLDGGFGNWLGHIKLVPSVWMGVEIAVLQLLAKQKEKSLPCLLCDHPRKKLPVNALLSGSEDTVLTRAADLAQLGYDTFKLKVGARPVEEDARIVERLRETVGPKAKIRLDANRAYDTQTAVDFAKAVQVFDIDYIEEPVRNYLELLQLTRSGAFRLPVALDESLLTISPKALTQLRGLRAIVLKPTLIGLEWSLWFARRAQRLGMPAVISSSFESSLGLSVIAAVGGCLNGGADGERVAMGLDTISWLTEDLTAESLRIEDGHIDLEHIPAGVFDVSHPSVREVTDD